MTLKNPIPEFLEYNAKHEVICLGTHLLADAIVIKVNIPYSHKIIKVRSYLNVPLATADAVGTLKDKDGTAFTGGVITITSTGSIGDLDASTEITAGDTQSQAKDSDVQLDFTAAPSAGEATFWLEVERTDP